MEPTRENDLFDIRLNDEGRQYIFRAFKLVWYGTILMCITYFLYLFLSIKSLQAMYKYPDIYKGWYKYVPWILIMLDILSIMGNIFYLLFVQRSKKSILLKDEKGFNRAFRLICFNAVTWIIASILSLLEIFISDKDVLKSLF